MSKFIKLTLHTGDSWFINTNHIIDFSANVNPTQDVDTFVAVTSSDTCIRVKESPDEILALIQTDATGANTPNNDWIEWNGGECPVDGEVRVHYECKDGDILTARAKFLRWEHIDSCGDIVKYRVIES